MYWSSSPVFNEVTPGSCQLSSNSTNGTRKCGIVENTVFDRCVISPMTMKIHISKIHMSSFDQFTVNPPRHLGHLCYLGLKIK